MPKIYCKNKECGGTGHYSNKAGSSIAGRKCPKCQGSMTQRAPDFKCWGCRQDDADAARYCMHVEHSRCQKRGCTCSCSEKQS